MSKLEVNEIFSSVQGEGKFAGKPATFLRLRRCNLQCPQCDEKDTWDRTRSTFYVYKALEIEEIIQVLNEQGLRRTKRLVITGGEPLIWKRQLFELVRMILFAVYDVEIETNGTISPMPLQMMGVHFNVSPKLESFHSSKRLRTLRLDTLNDFAHLSRDGRAIFKFVVQHENDFLQIAQLVKELDLWRSCVYIMPEGETRLMQLKKMSWIMQECVRRGYNFSPRLHILAFGNRKAT
jgi:organic radical activating enzyme